METTSVKLQEKTKKVFNNPHLLAVMNLKQGEHHEILDVGYDSFRQLLTKYLRIYPLPEGTSIQTIRISKHYRWVFKVNVLC
jgi:hypothetical protein